MSYGIKKPCDNCLVEDGCIDRFFIEGAVGGIHQVNGYSTKSKKFVGRGHLGGGTIHIDCQNFQPIPEEKVSDGVAQNNEN